MYLSRWRRGSRRRTSLRGHSTGGPRNCGWPSDPGRRQHRHFAKVYEVDRVPGSRAHCRVGSVASLRGVGRRHHVCATAATKRILSMKHDIDPEEAARTRRGQYLLRHDRADPTGRQDPRRPPRTGSPRCPAPPVRRRRPLAATCEREDVYGAYAVEQVATYLGAPPDRAMRSARRRPRVHAHRRRAVGHPTHVRRGSGHTRSPRQARTCQRDRTAALTERVFVESLTPRQLATEIRRTSSWIQKQAGGQKRWGPSGII